MAWVIVYSVAEANLEILTILLLLSVCWAYSRRLGMWSQAARRSHGSFPDNALTAGFQGPLCCLFLSEREKSVALVFVLCALGCLLLYNV